MSFAEKLKQKLSDIKVATIAPTDIAEQRITLCKECPEFFEPTSTCKKCGCFMTAKTKLSTAKCPLGKW